MSNSGKWVFTFDAPVHSRILRSKFSGVANRPGNLWWYENSRQWCDPMKMRNGEGYTNIARCRSFAAFERHLRKHPELRRAGEVVLVSNFQGHDIRAIWLANKGKSDE